MQIPNTPPSSQATSAPATAAAPGYSRPRSGPPGFDPGELAFLDLLNNLQMVNLPTAEALESLVPVLSADEGETSKTETPPTAQAKNTAPVEKPETVHGTTPPHEAALLKQKDLSEADLQFLNLLATQPNGLPWMGGGPTPSLPIQQALQAQAPGSFSDRFAEPFGLSEKITRLLQEANRSGRSIRVQMDEQSTLILRIREGRVSADFLSAHPLPGLQPQLDELRARMLAKNLPVDTLHHRPDDGRNARREQPQEQESKENT